MVAFFDPPLGDAVEGFEFFGAGAVDEAENVESDWPAGISRGGGEAVEDDGDEVWRRRRAGGGRGIL